MKKMKRITSLLLVFVMLCSLLPTVALAAGETYTVSLSGESSVLQGSTLKVGVDVTSGSEIAYNAFYATLTYDSSVFTYSAASSTLNGFTVESVGTGTLKITKTGQNVSISAGSDLELAFVAVGKAGTSGSFALTSAKVDNAANAEQDAPDAALSNATLNVTVGGAYTVSIEYGSDGTAKALGETFAVPIYIKSAISMLTYSYARITVNYDPEIVSYSPTTYLPGHTVTDDGNGTITVTYTTAEKRMPGWFIELYFTANQVGDTGLTIKSAMVGVSADDIASQTTIGTIEKATVVPARTLTISDTVNGTVKRDGSALSAGSTVTLSVTPDPGYCVNSFSVETESGNDVDYTFTGTNNFETDAETLLSITMPDENVTVTATFKLLPYKINTVQPEVGGTFTVSKPAGAEGQTITITPTAAEGYTFTSQSVTVKTVNGQTVSTSYSSVTKKYTFTMPAEDVTVTMTFETVKSYLYLWIEESGGALVNYQDLGFLASDINGKQMYSQSSVAGGTPFTMTFQADEGYELYKLLAEESYSTSKEQDFTDNGDGTYTYSFTMPANNVEIFAYFRSREAYTVSVSAEGTGTGTAVLSTNSAYANESVTLTLTPGENSYLSAVKLNGTAVDLSKLTKKGENYSYTFKMSNQDTTVECEFTKVTPVWSGSGTAGSPYLIRTNADMIALRDAVNQGVAYSGVYFRLENTLDLTTSEANWTPVGTYGNADSGNAFCGTFDGNGKEITYAISDTSTDTGSRLALFRTLYGGTVKNLTTRGSVTGYDGAAGVVAYASDAVIENCVNYASVQATGKMRAVGILLEPAGESVTIRDCVNYGTITGGLSSAYGIAGGQLGTSKSTTVIILNCANHGALTATDNAVGVAGIGNGTQIINCANFGTLNGGAGAYGIGSAALISGCYNSGDVTAKAAAAGITGARNDGDVVQNCYNWGTITTTGTDLNSVAAGIAAYTGYGMTGLGGTIQNCYNSGTITAMNGGATDAIVAYDSRMTETQLPTVKNSYYLAGSADSGYTGSVSRTASQLQSLTSTPLGDAFKETAGNYPILAWQTGEANNVRVTSANVAGVITATVLGTDYSSFVDGAGDVDVSLTVPGATNTVEITIQNGTLQTLANANASLTLSTGLGSVNLNSLTLAAAASKAGDKDVMLTIMSVYMVFSSAYSAAKPILDAGGSVYEITMTVGGTNIFAGNMTASFTLPYTRRGTAAEMDVKTYLLVDAETREDLEGSYIPSTEQVAFSVIGELGLIGIVEEKKNTVSAGDLESTAWDGYAVDVSWYIDNPRASSYSISTAAQLAGVAAIVNGLVNDDCAVWDGEKWISAAEWNESEYVNTAENEDSGSQGNNKSTSTYHYGVDDFNGQTILVTSDLDMNAGNYMPIGGQYLMSLNDYSTKLSSSFNGTFDGGGHYITIVCNRHCDTGNYGDGSSVGLIGRLGCHDGDPTSMWPTSPTVRNVAVCGSVYANRSVGGIVGKIGRTTGFTSGNNEQGGIIENCANFASIKNTDAKGCGGIVGAGWNAGIVRNCYNVGSVTSTYACPTGGISGSNEIKLENCYSVGTIYAASSSFAMGIGTNNGGATYTAFVENCWYLDGSAPGGGYFSGNKAYNDNALSSAEMKKDQFVIQLGSAFNVDSEGINDGYPVLTWQGGSAPKGDQISTTVVVNGVATTTVNSEPLAKYLAGVKSGDQITITAEIPSGTFVGEAVTVLAKSDAQAIANAGASLKTSSPVADITLSNTALKSVAGQSGTQVTIGASEEKDGIHIEVAVDGKLITKVGGGVQVTLPVSERTASTVLVLVNADGTETILEDAVFGTNSVTVTVDGSCVLKVTEKSKKVLSTTEIKNGVATTTIDSEALTELLKEIEEDTQLVITADIPEDEDVYSTVTVLTYDDVTNMADAGISLMVSSTLADIVLPNAALEDLADERGSEITVSATEQKDSIYIEVAVDGKAVDEISGGLRVTLPVSKVTDNTVLVLVNADGTETVIEDAVFGRYSVTAWVDGSCTLKVKEIKYGVNVPVTTVVKNGTATTTVDSKDLTNVLTNTDPGSLLIFEADIPGGVSVNEAVLILTRGDVRAIAEADDSILVSSPLADIVLSNTALADIAGSKSLPASDEVTITAAEQKNGTYIGVTVAGKTMGQVESGLLVTLPTSRTTAGTVMVQVDASGNETVIKKSVPGTYDVTARLSGSCTVKVIDNAKTFVDVKSSDWYADAVAFASAHELFNGISDTQFAPTGLMTRSMLVTVLHRLENTPAAMAVNAFGDVPAGTWYTDAVTWANENKIVTGYGNGSFGPEDTLTREQLATILYRYMQYLGLDVSVRGSLSRFIDGGDTSSWAYEAMQWAVGAGIITGKDGNVQDPLGSATRAEVATMLQRLINLMVQ